MIEQHRQLAIELIEWLQDNHSADRVEQVAEVSRRMDEIEKKATLDEAKRWASRPVTGAAPVNWDLWEMT